MHVRERMLQRGINEETVKDIIKNPDYLRTSFEGRKIWCFKEYIKIYCINSKDLA